MEKDYSYCEELDLEDFPGDDGPIDTPDVPVERVTVERTQEAPPVARPVPVALVAQPKGPFSNAENIPWRNPANPWGRRGK